MANGVEPAAADLDRALSRLEQAVSGVLERLNNEIAASKVKGEALDEAGRRLDTAMAEIRAALSAEKD